MKVQMNTEALGKIGSGVVGAGSWATTATIGIATVDTTAKHNNARIKIFVARSPPSRFYPVQILTE